MSERISAPTTPDDTPSPLHPGRILDRMTFRTRLLLSMCGLVLLAGVIIIVVADRSSRASTNALVHSLFREVSGHAVVQTRDFVLRAAPVAESLRALSGQGLAMNDLGRLGPQLLAFLQGNAGLTWVLYGDESGDYVGATRLHDGRLHVERTHMADGKTHLTEYEVQPDASWKVVRQEEDSGYDPRKRPFYILAREKGRLAWTEPYMFFTQGVTGISCVTPVNGPDGKFRGVFSVEFDLNALSEFVGTLSLSPHASVFLFTPDGTLLAHPNERNIKAMGSKGNGELLTLADTGDPLVDAFRRHLGAEQVRSAGGDEFHFFEFNHAGVGYLASTTVFPISEGRLWVVGAVAPQSDFLAAVWRTRLLALIAAAASLGLAAILAGVMARRISRPVQALIDLTHRVGAGDLEARAELRGGYEFRQLSAALNRMITDLRERLHLRHSLEVAMEVQKSLLPAGDPVSPLLDIAGRSKYCDQTGGDYYDFIDVGAVSPTALLVAVGDVMGHGIPAALVMATARAALRTTALKEHRLSELMTRTNHVLAADNRHNRFMTLSLLMIDAPTRVVRWSSAGHDPAIVFDPTGKSFHELEGSDLALGFAEGVEYREFASAPLAVDSVLVVGTDGVWEMFNEKKEQYGKERLQSVVRENHDRSAAEISEALEADLAAFRGLENPIDDVTFVVIKFKGAAGGA